MDYIKWKPIENLSKFYHFTSVFYEGNSLTIVLKNMDYELVEMKCKDNHKIILKFNNSLYSYRITEENFVMKTLNDIYNTNSGYVSSFFQVRNSNYFDIGLKNQIFDESREKKIHYLIITDVYIIDILSSDAPIVTREEI